MFSRLLYRKSDANFRIDNFIILFYSLYLIVTLSGYIFIKLKPISIATYAVYFIFVVLFYFGAYVGLRVPHVKYQKITFINLGSFYFLFLFLFIIVIVYVWYIMINKFGSIQKIMNSSFIIRTAYIGKDISIFPIYINYFLSFSYAFLCISLALYGTLKQFKYIITSAIFFIIIVLIDMTTFGRIGIIYSVFCFIGFLLLFKRKIFTTKLILLFSTLYGIVFLPRYIRGGGDTFSSTIKTILPNLKISITPLFYSFLVIFMYYFSSLFALSYYLTIPIEHTWGAKLFTPFYNIVNRIFDLGERKNIIDRMAYIPYDTNIYSIIKDMISDFGYVGLIVLSLFFGFVIGIIFKSSGIFFKALKIYMIGWILYTPLYNAFSFGSFFISFSFLLLLSFFFVPKNSNLKFI